MSGQAMTFPVNWQNPITAPAGNFQANVDPLALLPSRPNLSQVRLDMQKALIDAGIARHTPLQVNTDGVIWDGHHAVRIAAEIGNTVTVKVVKQKLIPSAASILDLPVG
jgi:hypothetical protein